jgi:hypothetical protein
MEIRADSRLLHWLAEIGIHTLEELRRVGAAPAYMEIKARHPCEASLPVLWSLASCVLGPAELSPSVRNELMDEIL